MEGGAITPNTPQQLRHWLWYKFKVNETNQENHVWISCQINNELSSPSLTH